MLKFFSTTCSLVFGMLTVANATSISQPVTINIYTKHSTFTVGQPIPLNIRLFNTSSQPMDAYKSAGFDQGEVSYKIFVSRTDGAVIQKTSYGRAIYSGHYSTPGADGMDLLTGSKVGRTLQPGEYMGDGAILTKIYNMNIPGDYRVFVSYPLSKGVYVNSNVVQLTVSK